MSSTTSIVFAGNLAEDPTLSFTANKAIPVAKFKVIVNRRLRDAAGNYSDGDPTTHHCTLYGQGAENAAYSLTKGDHVLVTGRMFTETWTAQDGERKYGTVVEVDELGASLRFATAQLTRNPRRDPAS